ncbi:hypothetical protein RR48_04865 [Papilio machaon]|uniref:Osiris 8 n=1 Tax=Papilio machaon TaxID=76193 RepID=A0A0N0PF25_PAPMA|nr:uncharacterized protein LOC106708278 [Papilio machaon]KPJ20267.1 hypothetical protein RR48_04865 [Papilio machaon]
MVPNYLLILTLAVAVTGRTASTHQNKLEEARSSEDGVLGDLKIAYETYKDCSGSEIGNCLKLKLAKALTRITKSDEINLLNGVTISKDKNAIENVETEEAIPRSLDENSLDSLILDKIVGFMRTHTIQIKFPTGSDLQGAFEEGRGRRKKIAPLLAIPLLIGGMMVPIAFGALALLAGKALIVSKLALVLAGIIGLKKLLSSSSGGEAHEVVVSAGHGGSGWSRSLDNAHDLAYKAYAH